MEGARGGPRSAAELAEAARGLNELLDVGLLTKEGYDAQFDGAGCNRRLQPCTSFRAKPSSGL